jgi:hypothetical protein
MLCFNALTRFTGESPVATRSSEQVYLLMENNDKVMGRALRKFVDKPERFTVSCAPIHH